MRFVYKRSRRREDMCIFLERKRSMREMLRKREKREKERERMRC